MVKYCYDNNTQFAAGAPAGFDLGSAIGRLTAVNYGTGSSTGDYYGYDQLGRVARKTQRIDTTNYPITATYNRASAMTGETYPSGQTVSYAFDNVGRLTNFNGNLGGTQMSYAATTQFNAASQIERENYGTSPSLYLKQAYNNRLQLVDTRLGTVNDATNWNRGRLSLIYGNTTLGIANTRDTAAAELSVGDLQGNNADNNGNIKRMYHFVPTGTDASQQVNAYLIPQRDDYTYDALNRLLSMTECQRQTSGSAMVTNVANQSYGYDRFGNLNITGLIPSNLTFNPANNRITNAGYVYDNGVSNSAGNITSENGQGRVYDAENRMTSAASNFYTYDGDGKRVKRTAGSPTCWYVYGIGGELLAEYLATAPTTVSKQYGYKGGRLLMTAEGITLKWLVQDHLGSTRLELNASGNVASRHDYLPFGGELYAGLRQSGGAGMYAYEQPVSGTRQRFTGKERDNETGLDYFGARYFSSVQGRFTSSDEFTGGPTELFAAVAAHNPTFYADLFDPQSLNKYSYCLNSPLKFIDPDGHQATVSDSLAISIILPTPRGIDSAKGIAKSVANVLIGASNIGNEFGKALGLGDSYVEPYQPSNSTQDAVMHTTDKLLVLGALLGGKGPANVMMAEGEGAAVATAQAATKGSLVRFGSGPETAQQLGTQAASAEAAGFPHGVSTKLVNRVSGTDAAHRSAPVNEVQQEFAVQQTGRNKNHHTVILPKPVTRETADKFNNVFKPKEQQ